MPSPARHGPSAAPVSSTANVARLNGTGVNGSGTATLPTTPTKAAEPTTSDTSRTSPPGSTSAKTGRGNACAIPLTRHPPRSSCHRKLVEPYSLT